MSHAIEPPQRAPMIGSKSEMNIVESLGWPGILVKK